MQDSHKRYVTVPKANVKHNCYVEATRNPGYFELFELHESDIVALHESGFLDSMNEKYGLMLDDFEGGVISEDLAFVVSEAEKISEQCPSVREAALLALRYGTSINFEL